MLLRFALVALLLACGEAAACGDCGPVDLDASDGIFAGQVVGDAGDDVVVRVTYDFAAQLCSRERGADAGACVGAEGLLTSHALSPDGQVLATVEWRGQGTLRLRDARTLHTRHSADAGFVTELYFTGGGDIVTVEDRLGLVFRDSSGRVTGVIPSEHDLDSESVGEGAVVAFQSDQPDPSGWWRPTVRIVDRETGEERRRIERRCYEGRVSSGGGVLAWWRREGIEVFDAVTGKSLGTIPSEAEWHPRALVSRDGLVAVRIDGFLELWGGRPLRLLSRTRGLSESAFSPDGKVLLATDDDGRVLILEVPH